jgi:hypothetical protein
MANNLRDITVYYRVSSEAYILSTLTYTWYRVQRIKRTFWNNIANYQWHRWHKVFRRPLSSSMDSNSREWISPRTLGNGCNSMAASTGSSWAMKIPNAATRINATNGNQTLIGQKSGLHITEIGSLWDYRNGVEIFGFQAVPSRVNRYSKQRFKY